MSCYICSNRDCERDCYYNVGNVCKYMSFAETFTAEEPNEPVQCDPAECQCTQVEVAEYLEGENGFESALVDMNTGEFLKEKSFDDWFTGGQGYQSDDPFYEE